MNPPSSACSTASSSSVVRASRGTTWVAANCSTRCTSGSSCSPAAASGVPVGVLHPLHQRAGLRLDRVDGVGAPRASSLRPERRPQPGHGGRLAAPDLGGAQDREHQVDPGLALGRLAEDVQAVADLGVLDLAEPAVDVQDEVVELLVVRALVEAEVAVHLGGVHQLPDLAADGRQLGRVHRRDVGVLVEQLLEPGDVAVRLGARHRRDQVVDDRGVRAALGLRALARVVDQERVDQRQVADRGVGRAGRPTARRSCRAATPSSRACRGGRRRRRRSRRPRRAPASGTPPGSGGDGARSGSW